MLLSCALLAGVSLRAMAAPDTPDLYNVQIAGAMPDGKTDATAAFQKTLDLAGRLGGGTVYAPQGRYLFSGHLSVPNGVTLAGMWNSVPAHTGTRDRAQPRPTDDGTTFLVT